mgnify:CR=1 FL=1
MKTLDWKKVEAFIAERKPSEVSAGLLEDWYWTAATVYEDGTWKDKGRAYVTSYWATPGFKATMPNGDVVEVVASVEETPEQAEERAEQRKKNLEDLKRLAETMKQIRGEAA